MTKKHKVLEGIRNLDLFADSPAARLHFNGRENHKTLVGGIYTISITIILLTIVIIRLVPIISKSNVSFSVVKEILHSDEE